MSFSFPFFFFLCDLDNKKLEKALSTGASLAGHCYDADDRMMKVSNKFENDMGCECVFCSIGAGCSLSGVH